MAYPYNGQLSANVGGGLGGLPVRKSELSNSVKSLNYSYFRSVTPGSSTATPPENAKFMRVTIVGGGGSAGLNASSQKVSGAGGGCSTTKIVPASVVTYTVGNYDQNSTASFTGYSMTANAGQSGANTAINANSAGGTGVGGDVNFTGGNGVNTLTSSYPAGGGGAAGSNGNGGNANVTNTINGQTALGGVGSFSGTGHGLGGGSAGSSDYSGGTQSASSGGGTGMSAGFATVVNISNFSQVAVETNVMWGTRSLGAYNSGTGNSCTPAGIMGGGGALTSSTGGFASYQNGGVGGIVIEYW